jgi:hypothetical protein
VLSICDKDKGSHISVYVGHFERVGIYNGHWVNINNSFNIAFRAPPNNMPRTVNYWVIDLFYSGTIWIGKYDAILPVRTGDIKVYIGRGQKRNDFRSNNDEENSYDGVKGCEFRDTESKRDWNRRYSVESNKGEREYGSSWYFCRNNCVVAEYEELISWKKSEQLDELLKRTKDQRAKLRSRETTEQNEIFGKP